MKTSTSTLFSVLLSAVACANAYFLVGHKNILVTERSDPIVDPGAVSAHVHTIQGGSNFGSTLTTAQLRKSSCTTVPIAEDHSNYWIPSLYFQWKNGSVSALTGGMVTYYLFPDAPGSTTAFPDDFRMISGDTTLRTYNASSFAQQAITFLCLNFDGTSTKYNQLPVGVSCPSGIRSQINFPSCWDGKNLDSPDHKSHVAFLSTGPDSGTCTDPEFPVTLPRIFLEFYWDAQDWESNRQNALNPNQPFVFANGDATGYGYHADFYNGWQAGVLQNVLDKCSCTIAGFGDPTCCGDAGVITYDPNGPQCTIPTIVSETVSGTLAKLPGNNPITGGTVPQPGSASGGSASSASLIGGAPATSAVASTVGSSSAPAATAGSSGSSSGSGSTGESNSSPASHPSSSVAAASSSAAAAPVASSSAAAAPVASSSAAAAPVASSSAAAAPVASSSAAAAGSSAAAASSSPAAVSSSAAAASSSAAAASPSSGSGSGSSGSSSSPYSGSSSSSSGSVNSSGSPSSGSSSPSTKNTTSPTCKKRSITTKAKREALPDHAEAPDFKKRARMPELLAAREPEASHSAKFKAHHKATLGRRRGLKMH